MILTIGEYITNAKNRLEFKSFADMAKVIGVPSSFLLRLSKVQSKEELKQENIENLERLTKYLQITIDELINPVDIEYNHNISEIKYLMNCEDIGIIIDEIFQVVDKENIKFNGYEMNSESKQILKDSLDIVKQLVKNKI
jgi:transcriptional regulator with XRE-family HTH domain